MKLKVGQTIWYLRFRESHVPLEGTVQFSVRPFKVISYDDETICCIVADSLKAHWEQDVVFHPRNLCFETVEEARQAAHIFMDEYKEKGYYRFSINGNRVD